MDIQFLQHHSLKTLSFPLNVLAPWSKINWPKMFGFIAGLSILFHWSMSILMPVSHCFDYCSFFYIYLFIWLRWVLVAARRIFIAACVIFVAACGILSCGMRTLSCSMWDLVPCPGIEPGPLSLGARSLSHWTTREVLITVVFVRSF